MDERSNDSAAGALDRETIQLAVSDSQDELKCFYCGEVLFWEESPLRTGRLLCHPGNRPDEESDIGLHVPDIYLNGDFAAWFASHGKAWQYEWHNPDEFDWMMGQKPEKSGVYAEKTVQCAQNTEKLAKKRARRVSEGSRVADILEFLNSVPDCRAEKRHGTAYSKGGQADVYGVIAGRHFEIEIKRVGKKARPRQASRLRDWAAVGAITGVASTVDDVRAIFENAGVSLNT